MYKIRVGLGQVSDQKNWPELGPFFVGSKKFDPSPAHTLIGSGRVFSGGYGRVYRVGWPVIKFSSYHFFLGLELKVGLVILVFVD